MGTLSVIQILIYLLILMLVFIAIRYLWISITQRIHHPEEWIYQRLKKAIPPHIVKLEQSADDKIRIYNFWFQIRRLQQEVIPGDFAELGVYKGESAWMIHNMAPDRIFHLFDTFQGFSPNDLTLETGEAATYNWNDFADTDAGLVREKLGDSANLMFHQGHFPETTAGMENATFSLVHIDADLHLPVRDGLHYFYPRLSPGGVIMIHDYTHKWEGLMRAVDQFVATIPENLIHVPDRFGTVMIIKNKKIL